LFHIVNDRVRIQRTSWTRECGFPSTGYLFPNGLTAAHNKVGPPRLFVHGNTLVIGYAPQACPEAAYPRRILVNLRDLQRRLHRADNQKHSKQVIAGMVFLLALCNWICGGSEASRALLMGGLPGGEDEMISPAVLAEQFGARPLHPAEMPALFAILRDLCRRANLPHMPGLYSIAVPGSMNAYALGGPERSAIMLTEGLLNGMRLEEIAALLAHEVAHIRNNDGWAMRCAMTLDRAIALASLAASTTLRAHGLSAGESRRLASTLPAIAWVISYLLRLALSRIPEFDADATAIEFIDDPRTLIAALNKLERYHGGSHIMAASSPQDAVLRFLHSHPPTSERVAILARLAH
jgi:heat shock protein HtpX